MKSRSERHHKRHKWPWTIAFLILIVVLGVYSLVNSQLLANPVPTQTMAAVKNEPPRVTLSDKDKGLVPFSILLLGVDTGDLGRTEQGRSDTMLLATINPETKITNLTSLPRDTYVQIPGQEGMDKLNHAYAYGGEDLAIRTVKDLLDIPIDFFITVNMEGLEEVVDAVGGIDITPTSTFDQDGYSFVEGQAIHLDGQGALAFARNRDDTGGDYGRQGNQRIVIMAILQSALEIKNPIKYLGLMKSLKNNIQTNLSIKQLMYLNDHYRPAISQVNEYQLSGQGQTIDGVSYEVLDENTLAETQVRLKTELGLD